MILMIYFCVFWILVIKKEINLSQRENNNHARLKQFNMGGSTFDLTPLTKVDLRNISLVKILGGEAPLAPPCSAGPNINCDTPGIFENISSSINNIN